MSINLRNIPLKLHNKTNKNRIFFQINTLKNKKPSADKKIME